MTQSVLPYKWSCGCGHVQLELTGEPFLHAHCFCDDCRARLKVACSKEKEAGKFNKLTIEGGLNNAAWWGSQCQVVKGKDKLNFFRAALHEGGRSANDTTRTITGVTTCCGTLAYYVPPSPGFVHVYLGSNGERLLPACGSWLCAPAFRPVDVKMMTSYCASSGIATPPKGHPLIPLGLACKYLAASMIPGSPGRGDAAHVQPAMVGAKTYCGKPIEYVDADKIAELVLPKPKISPW